MVFKIEKNQNYTVMSNHHLRDKNLSLKAKGLLSFMLSLPEDWDYSISGLVSICKEEETAIKTALKELKNQKYLRINKLYPNQTKTGKIEYEYVIYEEPYYEKKQEVENQPLEFQELENNIQINTNKQNTKKQIDKIDKTISHEEESNYQSNKKKKRHILTKDIIKREYIKSNDIELLKYDKFFKKILETYDIDDIATILHYVIKSVKGRNFKDENNKKIENKFGYLKKSILENIDKFKNNEIEWDEELGFFMDREGNVLYYGEWKEQYDKQNRHEIHSTSFEDKVETDPLFQKLNLQYNQDMGLYGKAISFALQGMVLMQNLTSQEESQFIMHVPLSISDEQKDSFTNLYSQLSSFEKVTIVVPKSIFIGEDDKITDLDSWYEINGIPKEITLGI